MGVFLPRNPLFLILAISTPVSEVSNRVGGKRGLARGDPSYARDSDLFLCPFSYATLRRRGKQFWGSIFAVLGPC